MDLKRQWCVNLRCADYTRLDTDNIRVFSYVEARYYCTTCGTTFSVDKGTFFESLRSPRPLVLEGLKLLLERNSLRAVERLNHHSPNRLLAWLALAGAHGAAVSAELIQNLHLLHVQIDELWTFVKKSRHIVCSMIHRMWVTCGFGGRSHCPVGYGS